MATRKTDSHYYKKRKEKLEKDLEKLQEQKRQLSQKEREVSKSLKEANANYILTLITESGKPLAEYEAFAKDKSNKPQDPNMTGESAYVSDH